MNSILLRVESHLNWNQKPGLPAKNLGSWFKNSNSTSNANSIVLTKLIMTAIVVVS